LTSFFEIGGREPRNDWERADRIAAYLEANPGDLGAMPPSAQARPGFVPRMLAVAGRAAADEGIVGPLYQQLLRGHGFDPDVLARRVPDRFATSPYLAEDYRRMTEDRGVMPVPGGQLARRPIDAMGPAERARYASDWERMDAQRQAAYRAMSAPAKARYAQWREGFERHTEVPPARTTAEQAADLLGAILAAAATPEGFIGFVPKSVNALAGVAKSPKLAQELVDLVNAAVQSVRNRLGRNARPDEIEAALRNSPVYRVWGDDARPWGRSWTTVDPRTVPDYRDLAGLPDQNTGRFLSSGSLHDTRGVRRRRAEPVHGNRGGLDEVLIPDAERKIDLRGVEGLNPEF
jgi:hypothetical protein